MSVWFEGQNDIDCTLQHVKDELGRLGQHYVGVVGRMPGLSSVELVDEGADFVTIKTNEGMMKRTNIVVRAEPDRVVVELDEEYQAGSMVTSNAHFLDEFTTKGSAVQHRTVISGLEAPGIIGFIYRKLGSKNIGNAFLASYKAHLEGAAD